MARKFSAITDKITVTVRSPINPINLTTITMSAWFNLQGTGDASFDGIMVYGTNGGFWWRPVSKVITYQMGGTGNGSIIINANSGWHHVALVCNNSNIFNGYVDGAADVAIGSSSAFPTEATLTIGNDTGNEWLNGFIADCAIWNVLLTASEIKALAQGARPPTIRQQSILGFWPLDGLQSPEPDLSGNANNGTVTGTALTFGPPLVPLTRQFRSTNVLSPITTQSVEWILRARRRHNR